jgi:hypothetical protein
MIKPSMIKPSVRFSGEYYRAPANRSLDYSKTMRIQELDRAAKVLRANIANELGPDIRLAYNPDQSMDFIVIEKFENGSFQRFYVPGGKGVTADPLIYMTDEDIQNPVALLKNVIARAKGLEQRDLERKQERARIDAVKSEVSGQVAPRVECDIDFAYAKGLTETRKIIEAFKKANLASRLPEGMMFVLTTNYYNDNQLRIDICRRAVNADGSEDTTESSKTRPSFVRPTMGECSNEYSVFQASRKTNFFVKLVATILPQSFVAKWKLSDTEEPLAELIDRAVNQALVLEEREKDVATFQVAYQAATERTSNHFEMTRFNFISAFGLQGSLKMLKALENAAPSLLAIHPDLHFMYSVDNIDDVENQEYIFIGLVESDGSRLPVLGPKCSKEDFDSSYVYRKPSESVDQFMQRALRQARTLMLEKTKREINLSLTSPTEECRVS